MEKFYFSKNIISGYSDYLGPCSIQSGFFSPIVQASNPTARNFEILVWVNYFFSNLFRARNMPNQNQYFSLVIFQKYFRLNE